MLGVWGLRVSGVGGEGSGLRQGCTYGVGTQLVLQSKFEGQEGL